MVLSITLLRDYQETIKTSTEVIKETICDIRPPLYLLWGTPWGKMSTNAEKSYPEVSVPFSASIFQQIASDFVRCYFIAGKSSNYAALRTRRMFNICRHVLSGFVLSHLQKWDKKWDKRWDK